VAFPKPDTQFKPGAEWRGNPGGRRKDSLTALLRGFLEAEDPKTKRSFGEQVVRALVMGAITGKPVATRQL
jgi:hypothetical protein